MHISCFYEQSMNLVNSNDVVDYHKSYNYRIGCWTRRSLYETSNIWIPDSSYITWSDIWCDYIPLSGSMSIHCSSRMTLFPSYALLDDSWSRCSLRFHHRYGIHLVWWPMKRTSVKIDVTQKNSLSSEREFFVRTEYSIILLSPKTTKVQKIW